MKTAVAKACLSVSVAIACSAQVVPSGSIIGRVVDQDGSPIESAQVHAELHGVPMAMAIRYVETDREGSFTIDRLSFGAYDVNGNKEKDGYPETNWALYAEKPLATTNISAEQPTAHVVLHFGQKAGVIIGSVRDAVTGKPLNSGFRISRDEAHWISSSAPAEFRFLIPSNVRVDLEVSASGYSTWRYNQAFRGSQLILASGEEKRLDIVLERDHDPSRRQSKFLIPAGYTGWVLLEFNVKGAPSVGEEVGARIFKFPAGGRLKTSSSGPDGESNNTYFYYAADGSITEISSDYWNDEGMLWGEYPGSAHGEMCFWGFFIGTHEQYEKQKNEYLKGVDKLCQ